MQISSILSAFHLSTFHHSFRFRPERPMKSERNGTRKQNDSGPALRPPPSRRQLLPQKVVTEEFRYARNFLDKMPLTSDLAERMELLCAFIVSGYSAMVGRRRKPFNPLLGETYDYVSEDGWRYHGEQVSHHPPITACYAEGPGWELSQTLQAKLSFSLFSVSSTSTLPVRLTLANGNEYSWNKVTTTIQNIRSEAHKRRLFNEGEMLVKSNTGIEARLKFHPDADNTVTGEIFQGSTVLLNLIGSWEKGLNKSLPDKSLVKIFEPIPPPSHSVDYYGFNDFTVTLNELHPGEKDYLPFTDTRFRPDQRLLENAEPERAMEAKKRLEKEQRKRVTKNHTPMWFSREHDSFMNDPIWRSNRRYWTAKEEQFRDGYSRQMIQLFEKP